MALAPNTVRASLFGGPASDVAKEALFRRTLAGLDADDVAVRAAAFGRAHYAGRARIEMRARLDWHQRQGHRVVIVSASPEYYVGPVGEELGVDGVVATRLALDAEGRLTGGFDGANCRGEQKRDRLEQWLADGAGRAADGVRTDGEDHRGAGERPFVWAYGNSAGDRAMLEAADIGVDAGRLGRWGKLRGFPSYRSTSSPPGDPRALRGGACRAGDRSRAPVLLACRQPRPLSPIGRRHFAAWPASSSRRVGLLFRLELRCTCPSPSRRP